MTTLDHAALRALAEAATPGPWEQHATHIAKHFERSANIASIGSPRRSGAVGYTPLGLDDPDFAEAHANAAFIAAFNPATALALLDEVARLRAAIAAVPEWGNIADCVFCNHHSTSRGESACDMCGHAPDCVRKP